VRSDAETGVTDGAKTHRSSRPESAFRDARNRGLTGRRAGRFSKKVRWVTEFGADRGADFPAFKHPLREFHAGTDYDEVRANSLSNACAGAA
jgi:hypothetical protein